MIGSPHAGDYWTVKSISIGCESIPTCRVVDEAGWVPKLRDNGLQTTVTLKSFVIEDTTG